MIFLSWNHAEECVEQTQMTFKNIDLAGNELYISKNEIVSIYPEGRIIVDGVLMNTEYSFAKSYGVELTQEDGFVKLGFNVESHISTSVSWNIKMKDPKWERVKIEYSIEKNNAGVALRATNVPPRKRYADKNSDYSPNIYGGIELFNNNASPSTTHQWKTLNLANQQVEGEFYLMFENYWRYSDYVDTKVRIYNLYLE